MAPATAAPRILSLATAVPPFVYRQEEARALAERVFSGRGPGNGRLLAVFDHNSVGTRNICVPLEWFEREHSFGEKNDLYIQHAYELSRRVVTTALEQAMLGPHDIDHVIFVSSTGVATPTIDARLANAFGFRPDVRRTPIWGLGCAAGAAAMARAFDFARGAPGSHTLVIAVELCSLAFQPEDDAKLSMVSASLFSDGAAAAIVAGPPGNGSPAPAGTTLEILGVQSTLWPDSLDVMGWKVDEHGLHVVMAREIPSAVSAWVRPALTGFLDQHGLALADITHFVTHPGGGRVLDAITEALGLPDEALALSRDVLREHGNMSSPTCLFVLRRLLDAKGFRPGELGLMTAMGPGFSAESVLLRAIAP
jgi:alkylresorcinol/alkylpyrone synthase